jgi:hypothetical protein
VLIPKVVWLGYPLLFISVVSLIKGVWEKPKLGKKIKYFASGITILASLVIVEKSLSPSEINSNQMESRLSQLVIKLTDEVKMIKHPPPPRKLTNMDKKKLDYCVNANLLPSGYPVDIDYIGPEDPTFIATISKFIGHTYKLRPGRSDPSSKTPFYGIWCGREDNGVETSVIIVGLRDKS